MSIREIFKLVPVNSDDKVGHVRKVWSILKLMFTLETSATVFWASIVVVVLTRLTRDR